MRRMFVRIDELEKPGFQCEVDPYVLRAVDELQEPLTPIAIPVNVLTDSELKQKLKEAFEAGLLSEFKDPAKSHAFDQYLAKQKREEK